MTSPRRYSIVTPVKNEEALLPGLIESMASQTVPPMRWIIVDDRSTDDTPELIAEASARHEWIEGVQSGRGEDTRLPGGEEVLAAGMEVLDLDSLDYFVRMDADLSFEADYFEQIFERFEKQERLGIATGVCFVPTEKGLVEEEHPRFHTRGPIKTYRIECFREIGGLEPGLGWDTVDEVRAAMLGWSTRSYPELQVVHHRPTQTAGGALRGRRNLGLASYYIGYHPAYLLARSLREMARKPWIVGGASMLVGFLGGYLRREPRSVDQEFVDFVRREQINRLLGRETVWK